MQARFQFSKSPSCQLNSPRSCMFCSKSALPPLTSNRLNLRLQIVQTLSGLVGVELLAVP